LKFLIKYITGELKIANKGIKYIKSFWIILGYIEIGLFPRVISSAPIPIIISILFIL